MKKNYILFIAFLICATTYNLNAQTGRALNFDGTNDQVNCGNDASVQITGSTITLEAIIKFDSFKEFIFQGNIINKEDFNNGVSGYMLRAGEGGKVNFQTGVGTSSSDSNWMGVTSPANTVALNQWYHIAGTYDGTDMVLYVDGVVVASLNQPGMTIRNSSPRNLIIGNLEADARNIDASIDEVRIWDVARTSTELMDNMDNELAVPQTGLVAYYKFNQGDAGGDNTGVTTLIDETGTNNGNIENFALTGTSSNFVADTALSIENVDMPNAKIAIYPNPAQNYLNVSNISEASQYQIFDVIGNKIMGGNFIQSKKIDVSQLNAGIYLIKLNDLESYKFIKR